MPETKSKAILILPEKVLNFSDDNKVYVLICPNTSNKRPSKRFVQVGLTDGINAEIKSGLKSGEKVVDTAATTSDD